MRKYAKFNTLGTKQVGLSFSSVDSKSSQDPKFDVLYLKNNEQKIQTIKKHSICVIYLYADWCGPCKNISGEYAKLAQKMFVRDKCILSKENVDLKLKSPEKTKSIPTFLFFIDGRFFDNFTIVGTDLKKLRDIISMLKKERGI